MADEKLVSEALEPIFAGDSAAAPVVAGEPVVPAAFRWRGAQYPVVRILQTGRGLGPCTHGSGEMYLRRHWYRILSAEGLVMRVYFERRPRSGGKVTRRWWLYSVSAPSAEDGAGTG